MGGERPVVAVATTGADAEECAAQARAAREAGADLVELRADLLAGPVAADPAPAELARVWLEVARAVGEVLGDSGIPVLLTVRTAAEGGGLDLDDAAYRAALAAVVAELTGDDGAACDVPGHEAGEDEDAPEPGGRGIGPIAAIDVELARGELAGMVRLARRGGLDVVASSHDFTSTPGEEELTRRLRAMQEAGAAVAKIAVTPADAPDVERLLGVAARARVELAIPIIAIAMGAAGAVTRLAGGIFGSALTFATAGGPASAPGQLPVAQVRAALTETALHRNRH
ncbi:type I 3-dehydroquinate dehydratase [Actinomyces sp. MRS3W]|uniref:type I 3-dehydroquinate dehydratase n=1 Tax=Actinomyces sp. MRS3W TaxID=2800796 RepID=UPI0028FD2E60|nr:type I 3-dehydroquinate dehydratase [Actinomyces sp. MRS3W]MDU0349384.1 type I 3-dehydroquinate dehydratase [Actinomyces sp. MRS3W]